MEKNEIYAKLKIDLKKAMNYGFYFQAVFIESAILEDRCRSALKHTKINVEGKNFHQLLNLLKSRPEFAKPVIRKKIPLSLIDDIFRWKDERNKLVHNLTNISYDNSRLEDTVTSGQELVRRLENGVRALSRYYIKQTGGDTVEKTNS